MSRIVCGVLAALNFLLGGISALAADAPASGQTVFLTVREPEGSADTGFAAPLLDREIIRQAFLLAARDELGLSTRDIVLREDFPESADEKSVPFELFCKVARVKKDFDVEYVLTRGQETPLWQWVFNVDIHNPASLKTLSTQTEAFSRAELKEVLTKAGLGHGVPAARTSSDVPSATQDLLWTWNEISVFAGVRRLHQEIREKGESPELLAALAIGYANLGTLTEYYYNAGFKAYYARALLYAERLMRKTDDSASALWHRAYVRTMVGLHNFALDDVVAAKKKQGATPPAKPLPFWTDIIDQFGQGNLPEMLKIAKTEPQRKLAIYLNYQAVLFCDLYDVSLKAIYDFQKECPDCPRAFDSLAGSDVLGPINQATSEMFDVTGRFVRKRLPDVPGLPESVQKRLKDAEPRSETAAEIAFRNQLIEDLKRAGTPEADRGEPSLSALGHAIEEIGFSQVMRRLEYETGKIAVPADETIATFRPLIAKHRYAVYIDAFSRNQAAIQAAAAVLRKTIDLPSCTYKQIAMLSWLYFANPTPIVHDWYQMPSHHSDIIFSDEMRGIFAGYAGPPDDRKYNRWFMMKSWRTSNKLPLAVAMRIARDWNHAKLEADVDERDYANEPIVLFALGDRYFNLKRYDDAERCASGMVRVNPSYTSYRLLAAVYKEQKDHTHWKETVDKALKISPQGLEQAKLQYEVALDHMSRKEWKEAVVYADAAAQSYSGWGLEIAGRCHEMLGDWKISEHFFRANSERYAGSELEWFYWCHRTGHGDVHAADEFAQKHLESLGTSLQPTQYELIGFFYLMTNEPDKALIVFKKAFEQGHELFAGLNAALIADTLGKAEERDALLQQVIVTPPSTLEATAKNEFYGQIATRFRDALPPKGTKLDLSEIEKTLTASADKFNFSTLRYLVASFAKNRGDIETAKTYFIRCAQAPDWRGGTHTLACQMLREMKVAVPPAP